MFISPAINRTGASDSDMLAVCNTLVESLFSVFVTAGECHMIQECSFNQHYDVYKSSVYMCTCELELTELPKSSPSVDSYAPELPVQGVHV